MKVDPADVYVLRGTAPHESAHGPQGGGKAGRSRRLRPRFRIRVAVVPRAIDRPIAKLGGDPPSVERNDSLAVGAHDLRKCGGIRQRPDAEAVRSAPDRLPI